jgi:hypothetical protein
VKTQLRTAAAALYRRLWSAGGKPSTILQDECDALAEDGQDRDR